MSLKENTARNAAILPLLGLYLAISVIGANAAFQGDEVGYVENATRMVYGPAPTPQDLRLWWGPGYPLALIPFLILRLPWIAAKILNAFFLFGAIAYFHALTRRYLDRRAALLVTWCLGLYPPLMRELPFLNSETLTFLLICGFMFHFCAIYSSPDRRGLHLAASSLYLAYLALTKVFFGYVIVVALALSIVLLLWPRLRGIRIAAPVFPIALL